MTPELLDAFYKRVQIEIGSLCWGWSGSKDYRGYAKLRKAGKTGSWHFVHRLTYEHFIGDIPTGLVIDHLCRNAECTNPCHLEAVTERENILRGYGLAAENVRKTHCKNGHEFTEENTSWNGRHRTCNLCNNARCTKNRLAAKRMSYV